MTTRGQAKSLDFGLAKLAPRKPGLGARDLGLAETAAATPAEASLTSPGMVVGTVEYMSPEQVRAEAVDQRTDLFSFGLVLYEMATGRRAFAGESLGTIFDGILNRAPIPALRINPELPPELGRIISKAIEKDSMLRYRTAAELKAELARLKHETEGKAGAWLALRWWARRATALPKRWLLALGLSVLFACLAVLVGLNVGGLRDRLLRGATAPKIQSLAVLPLENLSGDKEQDYFADGMTEELITTLAKISALKVISRTSAMLYKGSKKPLPQIAKELKVDALVEGSVLREGGQVRITAQLIQASTDQHLWADSYQRDMRDVLALQSEVARAIVEQIRIKLSPQEEGRLLTARTVKVDAYEAYLKGRSFWDKRDREGVMKGLEQFQRAVKIDPTYALAYAGIADSYVIIGGDHWLSPGQTYDKAKAAALKALQIDNTLAEAHTSLALIKQSEWDWGGAATEYKNALALNPGYATAHQWYSLFLCETGRNEQAAEEARRAGELDPRSRIISLHMGQILYAARQYAEAKRAIQRTLELSPDFFPAREFLGLVYLQEHRFEEGVTELREAATSSSKEDSVMAALGYAYALSGREGESQDILNGLKEQSRSRYVSPFLIALICVGLGKKGEAFEWLDEAYKQRDSELPWIGVEPMFDSLRSDPRFHELLHRMNLPA